MPQNNNPRQINLSRIPAEKRRAAWMRLQDQHADLAAWVTDPITQLIKKTFNGELIIEIPDVVREPETKPKHL